MDTDFTLQRKPRERRYYTDVAIEPRPSGKDIGRLIGVGGTRIKKIAAACGVRSISVADKVKLRVYYEKDDVEAPGRAARAVKEFLLSGEEEILELLAKDDPLITLHCLALEAKNLNRECRVRELSVSLSDDGNSVCVTFKRDADDADALDRVKSASAKYLASLTLDSFSVEPSVAGQLTKSDCARRTSISAAVPYVGVGEDGTSVKFVHQRSDTLALSRVQAALSLLKPKKDTTSNKDGAASSSKKGKGPKKLMPLGGPAVAAAKCGDVDLDQRLSADVVSKIFVPSSLRALPHFEQDAGVISINLQPNRRILRYRPLDTETDVKAVATRVKKVMAQAVRTARIAVAKERAQRDAKNRQQTTHEAQVREREGTETE